MSTAAVEKEELEARLEKAPKYGQNAAWLLLKSIADEEDEDSDDAPQPAAPTQHATAVSHKAVKAPAVSSVVQVDNSLFEAMPKSLRPNIAVSAKRAKIPRGPRITWLNRAISLYLEYIGTAHLQLHVRAALLQAAVTHEQHAFDACTNPTRYQNLLMRKQPALEHVPAAALAALCTYYCVAAPSPAPASTSASAPASASAPVNAASPATAPVIAPAPAASPAIALASFPAQDAALAMLPTAHAAAPASLAGSTAAGTPPSQAACCEGVAASCHPAAAAVLCGESLTHRTRGAEDEEQIQQRVESLFGEDADAVADAGTDAGAGAGRESDADAGPGAEVHAAADAVLHSTHASGGVAAVLPPVEPALVNSAQLEGSQPPGAGAAEAPVVTETAAPDPTGQRTDPEPVAASPAAPAQDEDCVPGASEHDLAVVDDAPTIEQPDAVARLSEPAPPSPPAPDGFADFLRERKVAERTAQRQRKRSRDKGAHAHGIEQRATNAHTDVNGQHSRSERAAHVDAAPAEAAGINHRHKAPEGTPSKKRMRDGSAEAVAAVRLQVQLFVGNMLEPLLEKRAINLRQYTEVLGRSVEKIMKVHSGSVDALFLESESKRVRRLVDRYVEFVKGAGAAADEQQN